MLKNYHQPPRKVRLVANLIRGKSVPSARAALSYLPKKSAPAMFKLLDSAVANARENGIAIDQLFIKTITVDKGAVLKRVRPFGRGRAGRLHKVMSIIKLELGTSTSSTPKKAAVKKVAIKKSPTQKKNSDKSVSKPKDKS